MLFIRNKTDSAFIKLVKNESGFKQLRLKAYTMSQVQTQFFLKDSAVKSFGKRTTYLVTTDQLIGLAAKPWSRQRPVDEARVAEIADGIATEKDVTGVLAMAWHPTENLVVYDGQHRWKALVTTRVPVRVFVEILWDVSEEEIIHAFKQVNNCMPVSELYTSVSPVEVRQDIELYVRELCETYPEFVSSKKPNRPNFNRDLLTDELFRLWNTEFQQKQSIARMVYELEKLNNDYEQDECSVPKTIARKHPKIFEKCAKHKFWLFAETGHINVNHLASKLPL